MRIIEICDLVQPIPRYNEEVNGKSSLLIPDVVIPLSTDFDSCIVSSHSFGFTPTVILLLEFKYQMTNNILSFSGLVIKDCHKLLFSSFVPES